MAVRRAASATTTAAKVAAALAAAFARFDVVGEGDERRDSMASIATSHDVSMSYAIFVAAKAAAAPILLAKSRFEACAIATCSASWLTVSRRRCLPSNRATSTKTMMRCATSRRRHETTIFAKISATKNERDCNFAFKFGVIGARICREHLLADFRMRAEMPRSTSR